MILASKRVSSIRSWAGDLDEKTVIQVQNVANLPFIHSHIAVMPDAHLGKGSTVGTVIATVGAIIPAAVGCDLGCGVSAMKLPFKADRISSPKQLRHSIERSIPTGRNSNRDICQRATQMFQSIGYPPSILNQNKLVRTAARQLGSLGGGNHFIELCCDTEGGLWIMLHSGSRNIGKALAEQHINHAKGIVRNRFESLPDPDLAYLTEGTSEFQKYINDMLWAQEYARINRKEMMIRIVKDLSFHIFKDARLLGLMDGFLWIDCHHNYCQRENHFGQEVWVTRKGAVSARNNELGIIPGSMGTKSFIVRGKGNPESFHSCSHGAGRRMSRTEAKMKFKESDLIKQTEGIECRKDHAIIDEIPEAYKNIEEVMRNQEDLVDVLFELRQIICIKGD